MMEVTEQLNLLQPDRSAIHAREYLFFAKNDGMIFPDNG